MADSAPAEFGRSSGEFINVVTKVRDERHARDAPRIPEVDWPYLAPFGRHSPFRLLSGAVGDTIGGAIRQNKLFYFAASTSSFHPDQAGGTQPHRPRAGQLLRQQIQRSPRERPDHAGKQCHRHPGEDRLVCQPQESVHGALQFRSRAAAERHLRCQAVG